ncbi:MAG: HAD family hydrolase [Hespellia sp.]|nr:HAD family hydrolase [Hespellia sp.]
MKNLDGIIFDVDGTLWDATHEGAASWTDTIRRESELSITLDSAKLKSVFGKPMDQICDALFPMLSRKARLELGNQCFSEEIDWLRKHKVPLYDHVDETLEKLSARVPLFIVSNCQSGYIEVMMETNGMEEFISGHLCFGDTGLEKWETIHQLMKEHHLKQVVYVGDTQGDYDACQKAGIPFIFASWGYGIIKNPPVRIDDIRDLL